MATKRVGTIPVGVKRIRSHQPCESCSLRQAKYKVTVKMKGGPTHRLCEKCKGAFQQ